MKKILAVVVMLLSFSAGAEITTKEQADKFLDGYCIGLVNEIEIAAKKRALQAASEDWKKVRKTDEWIYGLSGVYQHLCKSPTVKN